MKICIVGAGIAGLALGTSLHAHGMDVHIYEKAAEVRAGGSGITLAPNALTALDALGLGAQFRALQRNQRPLRGGLRAPSGTWLSHIPAEITTRSLTLDRAELHRLLSGPTVHTSMAVVNVDASTGEVDVHDGSSQRFDLIIGADGINSVVRRSCFDDPGIGYAGYNAWRALVDTDSPTEGCETWGARARFGVVPLHCGRTYWFAVASGPQAQPGELNIDELRATFEGWHHPIPELLRNTPENGIQILPIRELAAPLRSYISSRVVLVGDAAHAMTPNLGQGACQGLEDAAVLARLIVSGRDLAAYDHFRLTRSQRVARQSRLLGTMAHTPGPRLARVRNWVLKHTPDALVAKQTRTVVDWSLPRDLEM